MKRLVLLACLLTGCDAASAALHQPAPQPPPVPLAALTVPVDPTWARFNLQSTGGVLIYSDSTSSTLVWEHAGPAQLVPIGGLIEKRIREQGWSMDPTSVQNGLGIYSVSYAKGSERLVVVGAEATGMVSYTCTRY